MERLHIIIQDSMQNANMNEKGEDSHLTIQNKTQNNLTRWLGLVWGRGWERGVALQEKQPHQNMHEKNCAVNS